MAEHILRLSGEELDSRLSLIPELSNANININKSLSDISDSITQLEQKKLIFINTIVESSSFTQDNLYDDFPHRADIILQGCLNTMIPEVIFPINGDLNFAPICESYDGGVKIWVSNIPENDITIPTIILWRGQ